jgi:hypothetical protein
MNDTLNLKQTEKASFKLAAYADGLNDISLGLVMILMGFYPLTRELLGVSVNALFSLAILGLIFGAQVWAKKRLGPSRIGVVKFGERIQKRLRTSLLVGIILFLLTAGTWYLSAQGYSLPKPAFPGSAWFGGYGDDILVGLIVLAIFSGIAYTLEMTRFYLYGLLLGACFPLQSMLPVYQGTPYFFSAAVMIGIGIYLLTQFLQKYPVAGTAGEEN